MLFAVSALLVAGAFCLAGTLSSGRVKTAGDYAVANRSSGAFSVAGVIMGALVAGGSTIGTVQMAYETGLSAWWFTLGSGIGCALLGLRFAGPVRRSGLSTLPEFIERSYGSPTALLTLTSSIAGTLISVAAQFLAGSALLRSVLPVSLETATLLLALLILAFIFMGGLKSFGTVGKAKTVALYLLLAACCAKAFSMGQTPGALTGGLPFSPWLNPFGRGVGKDLGACLSLVAGILCTQIYMQAVFAASDEREARRGCMIAAFLIPPLGLMGVWVGLAMRSAGIVVDGAQALPYFLRAYFHPAIAGALWMGLAITVVGGAAGLCLGVATNLSLDVFARVSGVDRNSALALRLARISVVLAVCAAALMGLAFRGDQILNLSYAAMGLRASGMTAIFAAAILRPGLLSPRSALASAVLGLGAMLAAWVFFPGAEPLFAGLGASAAPLLWSLARRRGPFFKASP